MTTNVRSAPTVLIASDDATDAALVRKLLDASFPNVFTSTDPDKAVEDFDRRPPDVLVLAFKALSKAQSYCLGLYRLSKIQSQPHRTVILCDKSEIRQVSELCFKQAFDDYVLFWPMNHDAPRLHMSIHHALRELAARRAAGPSVAEFAAQARRLSELEALLDKQLALGGQRIEVARLAIEQADQSIGTALDGFSRRLGTLPHGVEVSDAAGLDRMLADLRRDQVSRPLRAAAESMQPLKRWAAEFRQDCGPYLESARTIGAMAQRVAPTVLVVDDDEFQHKMVARILEAENCEVVFATSGAAALAVLGKIHPDLILMDIQMSDMDGIEVTRRLKAIPRLANIPVVMITGKSEGNVVVDSLKAGAADFVVKPFDREKLIAKVTRWARPKASPQVRTPPS